MVFYCLGVSRVDAYPRVTGEPDLTSSLTKQLTVGPLEMESQEVEYCSYKIRINQYLGT